MGTPKPTVALCMIVKNEASVIRRCIESVRPLIDSWVIVDTGSTDGTQAIARDALRDLPGSLVERPWRDFAANRTEALRLARPLGIYSLIIDADDTLRLPPGFVMPLLRADSYIVTIDQAGCLYERTALVRSALPCYEGVLHEFLVCERARTRASLPIVMMLNEDGARRRDPTTYRKDVGVLEAALAVEQTPFLTSRYTFYLAQSYRDCGERRKAIALYLRRAGQGGWDEERYVSLLEAGRLKATLGEPLDSVLETLDRAIALVPARAEARHAASRACRLSESFGRGAACAEAAVGLAPPKGGLFVETWVYAYRVLDELGVNAYWAGDPWRSLDATLLALASGAVSAEELPRLYENARFAFAKIDEARRLERVPGRWTRAILPPS